MIMTRGQMTAERQQSAALVVGFRRPAIVLSLCTMALCPIESVCITRESEDGRQVTCGHFKGTTTINGSHVICGYCGR